MGKGKDKDKGSKKSKESKKNKSSSSGWYSDKNVKDLLDTANLTNSISNF